MVMLLAGPSGLPMGHSKGALSGSQKAGLWVQQSDWQLVRQLVLRMAPLTATEWGRLMVTWWDHLTAQASA